MTKKLVEVSREAWIKEVKEWEPEPTKAATLALGKPGARVFIRRPGHYIRGWGLWCALPAEDHQGYIILKACQTYGRLKKWCAACGWEIEGVLV
jgi:hypothetical protein